MTKVEQVGSTIALLGECPVWSGSEQVLYWEDIDGRCIHRWDPVTCEASSRTLDGRPGSFVLSNTDGELIVAMEHKVVRLTWASGVAEDIVEIEDAALGNRSNDGRCDSHGRFYAGTMWPDVDERRFSGGLYRLDADGSVHTIETDVGVPNGLAFDDARNRMYWADSLHGIIWVWDYDVGSGVRSNRRVFYDYGAEGSVAGAPDGGCVDAEGGYWSASVHGWALTRINPDGVVDHQISLPVRMPTMPAFGGAELSTLYVTSIADDDRTPEAGAIAGGALLQMDPGVRGLPEPVFRI